MAKVSNGKVVMKVSEYISLLSYQKKFEALEDAGVEEWEYFEEAMDEANEEIEYLEEELA